MNVSPPHPVPLAVLRVSHGHLCWHGGGGGGGRRGSGVPWRRQRRPENHHQEGGEGRRRPSLLSHTCLCTSSHGNHTARHTHTHSPTLLKYQRLLTPLVEGMYADNHNHCNTRDTQRRVRELQSAMASCSSLQCSMAQCIQSVEFNRLSKPHRNCLWCTCSDSPDG